MKYVWTVLLIRGAIKYNSSKLQKKLNTFAHLCCKKWNELVHGAHRNYRDIVKIWNLCSGQPQKANLSCGKVEGPDIWLWVEAPCCATGQAVCVNALQRPESSGWLWGPSDLAWPAPSVRVWQRSHSLDDWLVHWLAGELDFRLAERLHDWLGGWLVGYSGG